jgi:uncharacterized membrane protein YtjA (UPF0391 family)
VEDSCHRRVSGKSRARFRHEPCTHVGRYTWLRHDGTHGGRKEIAMLYYALVFLVVGLIAGALGLLGIAAVAGQIAWILFLVALVFVVIHLVTGRRMPIS